MNGLQESLIAPVLQEPSLRDVTAISGTVVMQRVRWISRAFHARDRAQIFVDCVEIVVRHALENRPRHDLKKIAVAIHGRKTGSIGSAGAWRV